ncbi:carboxyl transferase domain-containing protein [Teichococcus aestuarii]|uniref:carboxyl transferase domain-containing protein n=1 Tax=Teichococcus aestuarii TaxID=568898 RepID=UPI003611D3BC
MAQQMGGADKVRRQHEGGRLTVRERVDRLADPGSFHEIGAIAGRAEYEPDGTLRQLVPSNCVFGRAEIDGRPVVVVGDDFTVRGGSADATIREKPLMAERMAHEYRLPIIRVIEGSGGGGSVKTIETTGRANLPGASAAPACSTTPRSTSAPCRWWGSGSVRWQASARRGWPPATTR